MSEWKEIETYEDYPKEECAVLFRETRTIECSWTGSFFERSCSPFDYKCHKPKKEWKAIDD